MVGTPRTIAPMLTGTTRALRPRCQGGVSVAVCVRKHTISAIWRPAAG